METYFLLFKNDDLGVARKIEFEAEDAARALIFAHNEAKDRSAELWKGDTRLCTVRRSKREELELPAFLRSA